MALAVALACACSGTAFAQRGIAREGAIYLLLPLGARIVGSGQSVASPEPSTEQLFWNPGAVARASQRELAFHNGQFFVGPMSAIAGVFPFGRAGVVGATVAVLDYGTQEVTVPSSSLVGQISQQSYIFAATYAATLGSRVSLGVTLKNARFVGTCSGLCDDVAHFDVSTTAVDVGMQYRAASEDDIVLGAAIRHAGPRFQLYDEPQSDPLPTRVQAGASYRLRVLDDEMPGTILRLNADAIDRLLDPGAMAVRFGAELTWRGAVAVRASYVAGSGEGTGGGVGIGFVTRRITFDVAQTFGGATETAAIGSTFFSLRGRW